MIRDGELIEEPGYATDVITDDALDFLNQHAVDDKPFYLSVHYTVPHSPWIGQQPQEIVNIYENCSFESCPQEPDHPWVRPNGLIRSVRENIRGCMKGYFAAITAMDINIGRIIDKLETLGLRDNTLICFMSDNGFNCGHHGIWGKGNGTFPRNGNTFIDTLMGRTNFTISQMTRKSA